VDGRVELMEVSDLGEVDGVEVVRAGEEVGEGGLGGRGVGGLEPGWSGSVVRGRGSLSAGLEGAGRVKGGKGIGRGGRRGERRGIFVGRGVRPGLAENRSS
jgi:hypothetical protein